MRSRARARPDVSRSPPRPQRTHSAGARARRVVRERIEERVDGADAATAAAEDRGDRREHTNGRLEVARVSVRIHRARDLRARTSAARPVELAKRPVPKAGGVVDAAGGGAVIRSSASSAASSIRRRSRPREAHGRARASSSAYGPAARRSAHRRCAPSARGAARRARRASGPCEPDATQPGDEVTGVAAHHGVRAPGAGGARAGRVAPPGGTRPDPHRRAEQRVGGAGGKRGGGHVVDARAAPQLWMPSATRGETQNGPPPSARALRRARLGPARDVPGAARYTAGRARGQRQRAAAARLLRCSSVRASASRDLGPALHRAP